MNRLARQIAALSLWWSACSVVYIGQLLSMSYSLPGGMDRWDVFIAIWFAWLVWVPLSLIAIALTGRFPLDRHRLAPAAAAIGAFVALVVICRALYVFVANAYAPLWYEEAPALLVVLRDSFLNNVVLAALVIGATYALHYREAANRHRQEIAVLETSLIAARLDALGRQINPHFLFNTLNAISEMVHLNPDVADDMLISLAALLRKTLVASDSPLVTVRDELETVEHYLNLQRARFGDRLQATIAIDPGCLPAAIPPLSVQPLVENAVIHGIAQLPQGGKLQIVGEQSNAELLIRVYNDGPAPSPAPPADRIGLDNIRTRLNILFPGRADVTLIRASNGQTCAALRLPIERGVPAAPKTLA